MSYSINSSALGSSNCIIFNFYSIRIQ
jgi:hypothetical protein